MEFPINNQEELNTVIGDRLEKERRKFDGYLSPEDAAKKYEGYLSPEQEAKKYKGYLTPEQAAEKDAQIHKYETDSVKTRVALEIGLPYEMASRLTGDNEEAIRTDADNLAKLIGTKSAPPLADPEPSPDTKDASMKKLLKDLTAE